MYMPFFILKCVDNQTCIASINDLDVSISIFVQWPHTLMWENTAMIFIALSIDELFFFKLAIFFYGKNFCKACWMAVCQIFYISYEIVHLILYTYIFVCICLEIYRYQIYFINVNKACNSISEFVWAVCLRDRVYVYTTNLSNIRQTSHTVFSFILPADCFFF